MNKLRLKFRQFRYRLKHDFLSFGNIALAVTIIFCLSWTWGAISSMSRNWELEQRLISRKKELTRLKLEVETLSLENDFYKTAEYQELSARRHQFKRLPGETMIALPPNTSSAQLKHLSQSSHHPQSSPSNFSQWLSFLFAD